MPALRDFYFKKKPYTQPECRIVNRAELPAVVREKLQKYRSAEARRTHARGIRSVLFIEDTRNIVGELTHACELSGTQCLQQTRLCGAPLYHLMRAHNQSLEPVHVDILLLDLREATPRATSFLAELSAQSELRGIPLVVLLHSIADSLILRGSDFQGSHSFTGPVHAEYFQMAMQSFLDLWAPY